MADEVNARKVLIKISQLLALLSQFLSPAFLNLGSVGDRDCQHSSGLNQVQICVCA